jgi:ribosomal protein S18 acetylase RimI-like enzyme
MQFELTEALINDILFSMEDQNGEFYMDTQEGIVISFADSMADSRADSRVDSKAGDRFISLPKWDSAEGYRLMERFTAGFKNPVVREKLTAALDQGKGVFRAFKNALGSHPEVEQLWFVFKEREMKRGIIRWYNALREEWGLERIGIEPEETDDLVLEDFRFREGRSGDEAPMERLHRQCLEEGGGADRREWGGSPSVSCSRTIIAETGAGDFAGYIAALPEGDALCINRLEVRPEFRGLGIGEALLARLLEGIDRTGIAAVFLDLPAGTEGFSRVLFRTGFKSHTIRYCLPFP